MNYHGCKLFLEVLQTGAIKLLVPLRCLFIELDFKCLILLNTWKAVICSCSVTQAVMMKKKILIFASNEGLQQLENAPFLGMDGTFKSSPSAWYQLFTIHAIINGRSYPRAFILLPDKTQATYDKTFLEIKKIATQYSTSSSID